MRAPVARGSFCVAAPDDDVEPCVAVKVRTDAAADPGGRRQVQPAVTVEVSGHYYPRRMREAEAAAHAALEAEQKRLAEFQSRQQE